MYNADKAEFNSPRGKLELVFEVLARRIDPKEVIKILPSCDECIECISICPHGIDVPRIFEELKAINE